MTEPELLIEIWLVVYSAGGHEYGWPVRAFGSEKEAKVYALVHPTNNELGNSYTPNVQKLPFGEG